MTSIRRLVKNGADLDFKFQPFDTYYGIRDYIGSDDYMTSDDYPGICMAYSI